MELLFEFHYYLKLIFIDEAGKISGVSIVPHFSPPFTKILWHIFPFVPFQKEICEETQSMSVFKTP